jgi:hypothetical protein
VLDSDEAQGNLTAGHSDSVTSAEARSSEAARQVTGMVISESLYCQVKSNALRWHCLGGLLSSHKLGGCVSEALV